MLEYTVTWSSLEQGLKYQFTRKLILQLDLDSSERLQRWGKTCQGIIAIFSTFWWPLKVGTGQTLYNTAHLVCQNTCKPGEGARAKAVKTTALEAAARTVAEAGAKF